MLAGAARTTITPDLSAPTRPVWLAGFGHGRRATSIHDELSARALLLDVGGCRVGLVAVDLIGFLRDEVERVRRDPAVVALGLDHLVVVSTHTHAGPDTLGLWGPHPFASGVAPGYLRHVRRAVAVALGRAHERLVPVLARFAVTRTPDLIGALQPVEAHDDRLLVMHLERSDGRGAVATVVNWGNHPEVLWEDNQQISSDYPHALRRRIEQEMGGVALFCPGAIGKQTPDQVEVRDADGTPAPERSLRKMDLLGELVAERALAALRLARPQVVDDISLRRATFRVPLTNVRFLAGLQQGLLQRRALAREEDRILLCTETSVLELGPATFLAVPGELYPELVVGAPASLPAFGYDPLRTAVTRPYLFVLGLANDELGYVVPPHQWGTPMSGPVATIDSVGEAFAPALFGALRSLLPDLAGGRQAAS